MNDKILVGLGNGCIVEVEEEEQHVLIQSHWDGEVWGLCMIREEES
jgi:hypothetical protein